MKQYKFRYELDKSSKKHNCCSCGKKRAVRYIDSETGNYLPIEFSRCDREEGCGYWEKPKNIKSSIFNPNRKKPVEVITVLNPKLISQSGRNFKENYFIQYLKTRFTNQTVKFTTERYLIGTSKYLKNACIFWQVDERDCVRAGKVMKYNPNTGKRVKGGSGIHWMFSILKRNGKIKDYHREQCFFGLHLINEYKTKVIAICESEKTACIMSVIYDDYLWMACGSATGLQDYKFIPLKDRRIILYPDKEMYDKWKDRAKELGNKGYTVEVSDVVERFPGRNGCDIADYFVDEKMIEAIESSCEKTPEIVEIDTGNISEEDKKLHQLASKNPKIINLIKTFDLTDTNGLDFKLDVLGAKSKNVIMEVRN